MFNKNTENILSYEEDKNTDENIKIMMKWLHLNLNCMDKLFHVFVIYWMKELKKEAFINFDIYANIMKSSH